MKDRIKEFKENIKNKKVDVLGIGISNRPLINFLLDAGAIVTARDKKTENELGEVANELKNAGVKLVCGENYMESLDGEMVFRTPGIRFDHPSLLKAKEQGALVTSEMEVFVELCPSNIIAITGSDGKTTTTTLVYKMLEEQGYKTYLGGNIGTPLLSKVHEMQKDDFVVLELSSFQLHTMKKSPEIALVTNITPNHLDYHIDYNEYIDAKKNIFIHQSEKGKVVLNLDNDVTAGFAAEAKGSVVSFSKREPSSDIYFDGESIILNGKKILSAKDIKIPGAHNIENYMAAIGAVGNLVSEETIEKIAKTFGGVPHRIELVRELDGVKYYNSSIDSSPNRTINTLKVFNEPVVLIAGGKDKGIPYDEIGKPILEHVKALVLIGATSEVIYKAVKKEMDKEGKEIPVYFETEYEKAVLTAKSVAEAGDVVLLSNASTSFDMFRNFEERGNLFKELVNKL
ncbi:MAG: UDP-N-acetylmuramoyl-L-alanine--D-glutamate ligase [Clostridia bacterium]|nr:UDP-N-acetylmuramoyl-L-alanine--D-glutamate ligase [Clostridia bacterium]